VSIVPPSRLTVLNERRVRTALDVDLRVAFDRCPRIDRHVDAAGPKCAQHRRDCVAGAPSVDPDAGARRDTELPPSAGDAIRKPIQIGVGNPPSSGLDYGWPRIQSPQRAYWLRR